MRLNRLRCNGGSHDRFALGAVMNSACEHSVVRNLSISLHLHHIYTLPSKDIIYDFTNLEISTNSAEI